MALRLLSTELIERPGASVPCSRVFGSCCSRTSRVLRLGNFWSPAFSRTRAFAPSQTTTHSPSAILTPGMGPPVEPQAISLLSTLEIAVGLLAALLQKPQDCLHPRRGIIQYPIPVGSVNSP